MVQNKTKWFFLEPFLKRKDSIHLSEISRILETSHTIVRRYLMDFENIGLLKKEVKGRQTFYSLNKDFSLILDYLIIVEKEKLIRHTNSSLLLKELVHNLHKIDLPILIFGSFAQIKRKNSNDIDLLVVGNISKKSGEILDSINKKLNKRLHIINIKNINEISEALKIEVLSKHLIINNSELILRWLR